jgi:hypothetical protein
MIVRLKTTDYHYCAIPADIVEGLLAASSMGTYYNANIRGDAVGGAYDCRRHPVPTFD